MENNKPSKTKTEEEIKYPLPPISRATALQKYKWRKMLGIVKTLK